MFTTYAPTSAENGYALGLRLPTVTEPVLKLHWRGETAPPSPDQVDNLTGWGFEMGANNQFGTCGPTSVSNYRDLTTWFLTGKETNAPIESVYDLYRRSGSPDFDPRTGRGDNGVTMQQLCMACERGGFNGVNALGYAQLADPSDASVQAAIDRFGGVLMAVNLQTAQSDQTRSGYWDYQKSRDWGGHAILAGGYSRANGRIDVVTWQKRVWTSPAFRRFQADSYWIVIWPELITSGKLFDPAIDAQQFAADYQALTGRPFPATVPPTPPPVPPVPPSPPTPGEPEICLYPDKKEYRLPAGWKPRPMTARPKPT